MTLRDEERTPLLPDDPLDAELRVLAEARQEEGAIFSGPSGRAGRSDVHGELRPATLRALRANLE